MKKTILLITIALIFFSACIEDEEIIPSDPIEDNYSTATFNYDYNQIDPTMTLIFDAYLKTYESSINQEHWPYLNYYSLKDFNTVVFNYDAENNNFKGVYMIIPSNGKYSGDLSNVLQTSVSTTDGTKIIHVQDATFLNKLIAARLNGGSFGISTVDNNDYLYFFLDKSDYEFNSQPLGVFRAVGYLIHEGFHQFPQITFKQPDGELKNIRFNLPADYPADSISFSLIGSGIKMYEDILFTDSVDMNEYMKRYYVLFKKLKELDTSGKNYIDKFYLFECWLEGGAEFTEYTMLLDSKVMDRNIQEIRYDNSFQEFKDNIEEIVASGEPPTTTYNGVETVIYYATVVESTYYKLGSATLFILDNLGVNVYEELKSGKNPYQMLEEYINNNNISIDETQVYEDIKSQINWEETKTLMQNYIELFP